MLCQISQLKIFGRIYLLKKFIEFCSSNSRARRMARLNLIRKFPKNHDLVQTFYDTHDRKENPRKNEQNINKNQISPLKDRNISNKSPFSSMIDRNITNNSQISPKIDRNIPNKNQISPKTDKNIPNKNQISTKIDRNVPNESPTSSKIDRHIPNKNQISIKIDRNVLNESLTSSKIDKNVPNKRQIFPPKERNIESPIFSKRVKNRSNKYILRRTISEDRRRRRKNYNVYLSPKIAPENGKVDMGYSKEMEEVSAFSYDPSKMKYILVWNKVSFSAVRYTSFFHNNHHSLRYVCITFGDLSLVPEVIA